MAEPKIKQLGNWDRKSLYRYPLEFSSNAHSHLQACGIINDHWEGCFRYQEMIACADVVRRRRRCVLVLEPQRV